MRTYSAVLIFLTVACGGSNPTGPSEGGAGLGMIQATMDGVTRRFDDLQQSYDEQTRYLDLVGTSSDGWKIHINVQLPFFTGLTYTNSIEVRAPGAGEGTSAWVRCGGISMTIGLPHRDGGPDITGTFDAWCGQMKMVGRFSVR